MEYDFYPVKRHVDTHNRIFGKKVWCIQVRNLICATEPPALISTRCFRIFVE